MVNNSVPKHLEDHPLSGVNGRWLFVATFLMSSLLATLRYALRRWQKACLTLTVFPSLSTIFNEGPGMISDTKWLECFTLLRLLFRLFISILHCLMFENMELCWDFGASVIMPCGYIVIHPRGILPCVCHVSNSCGWRSNVQNFSPWNTSPYELQLLF